MIFSRTHHFLLLATIMLMDILTGMEFDLFVPSFPLLQDHFALSASAVTALLSVNFIGFCMSLFVVGDLSDRYGRKLIILFGLILFVLGSLLCLSSHYFSLLLVGRFIQGIGIAAPSILSFLIIADHYSPKNQAALLAVLNGLLNIAYGFAPVIGSYIALYFQWQGNFFALLLLGLFVLLMTFFFVPLDEKKHTDALSPTGFAGYIAIFKSKTLVLMISNLLFTFIPYWIFVGMSPLLYMKSLGVSLEHFGYYQGVLAFLFGVGSLLYGFYIRKEGYELKKTMRITAFLFTISIALIFSALTSTKAAWITFAMLVFVMAQIIPSAILYPICLNYSAHSKGRVSAVLQASRLILTAISLQITSYFYVGSFTEIGVTLIFFIVMSLFTTLFLYIQVDNIKV